jgi:hypothetical protein
MKDFIICENKFLSKNTMGYFRYEYTKFKAENNPDFLNYLKNPFNNTNEAVLQESVLKLKEALYEDLPRIKDIQNLPVLTVCVVPQAKAEGYYSENQILFKRTISSIISDLNGFENGTDFIIRHKNTKTTYMQNSGHGGDGEMPYEGITKDTCHISAEVYGKDILLIDDIYTHNSNIDEDAIQALLDKGAKSVIFYAVAKTRGKRITMVFSLGGDGETMETIL